MIIINNTDMKKTDFQQADHMQAPPLQWNVTADAI